MEKAYETRISNVAQVDLQVSPRHPELVVIDKEPNNDIMHLNGLGEADGLAGSALNPH